MLEFVCLFVCLFSPHVEPTSICAYFKRWLIRLTSLIRFSRFRGGVSCSSFVKYIRFSKKSNNRNLNCEIKSSQLLFLVFYSVTETSWHSNQRPCMLEFLVILGISCHGGIIHIQPSPTEKLFQSRFQLNFYIGDPMFSIVHSIK